LSQHVLQALDETLRRGEQEGLFRPGVQAVDLHMLISSFCFYRVSNRHTFSEIFQIELEDREVKERHKAMISDSVTRYLMP
jgi:hypothetical protein